MVYAQAGSLLAVPFDLAHLKVTGSPVPVLDGVLTGLNSGNALFTISSDGTLAYMTGGNALATGQVVLVSQNGTSQVLTQSTGAYEDVALSPDGTHVALSVIGPQWAIWLYDIRRATLTRLTLENDNRDPLWTPDGKRVIYSSFRNGQYGLYWKPADGSGPEEQLLTGKDWLWATSFSRDGKELAYMDLSPETGADIWILPLEGDHKLRLFLRTRFNELVAQFSPDGRWLAYESDESGRPEIYVRQYPGPGGQWQISNEGGSRPVWSHDGRQLFYRNGDKLMAVPIETQPVLSADTPRLLFERTCFVTGHYYDVMSDGRHLSSSNRRSQPREPPGSTWCSTGSTN
jgi:Tol biopolymer transport system component